MGRPKDSFSLLELGVRICGRGEENNTGELGAGDPGQGRLILVSAADLEEVKEVGRGGVDEEKVLVRGGDGVGEVGYGEVFGFLVDGWSVDIEDLGEEWYLDVLFHLNCTHPGELFSLTRCDQTSHAKQ